MDPTSPVQVSFEVEVSSRPGADPDLWDSGKIVSSEQWIEYGGRPLAAHRQAFWRVRTWDVSGRSQGWSEEARWSLGPVSEVDWEGAIWIGRDDLLESTQEGMPGNAATIKPPNFFPAPHLRKKFQVQSPVRSALLYVCGLGFAEVYLNGQKIGDAERDPGFTNFDRSALFVTHDVTKQMHSGENVIGAILGTGWYDTHDVATWHINTAPWRQRPRMLLTLVVQHEDGSRTCTVSDDSWKSSAGPILRDGIYTGEIYDARNELSGWSTPAFDDAAWSPVLLVDGPRGKLKPRICDPVRVTETIVPVAITEPTSGVFLVDLGTNISGHMQLRTKGPAGQAITLRYAELLNPDGTLNAKPLVRYMQVTKPPQPFQQDTYVCKGSAEQESWEQRFSWSGFQFAEISNFPGKPVLDNFRGRFAHTDLRSGGHFQCSDDTANLVQAATRRSFLSNAQSYPTDCPQREKNGWTGDAGIAAETGLLNFQSATFYAKWLEDFAEAQRPDGGIPVLVPNAGWANGERWPGDICPPWDAAYPIITWELYRATGDHRVLERHVKPLQRYVEFFLSHCAPNGLVPKLGLGDYSPFHAVTSVDFIANVYLYYDLQLLANIQDALGRVGEAQRYEQLAENVAKRIHEVFYSPQTHRYSNGTQTAQGMALHFGLVPEQERAAVIADLVAQIETLGSLDVGFLGAKFVTRALAEAGHADLAYRVCMRTELPGYGYWVKKMKSTTLWETWNGGGSYNHIMFGDISAWMMQWIAGLQQDGDSVGYRKIVFRPNPVAGLTSAHASYLTPYGEASIAWQLDGNKLTLDISVPSGAEGRVEIPTGFRALKQPVQNRLANGMHQLEVFRR